MSEKKILNEIFEFTQVIPGNTKLKPTDRQTIINDVYLNLIKKQKENILKLDNFEDYKDYMYTATKNQVFTHFNKKKTKRARYTENILQEDLMYLVQPVYQVHNYNNITLKMFLNSLTPHRRAFLRWIIRGWTIKEAGEIIFQLNERQTWNFIAGIKQDLLLYLDGVIKKKNKTRLSKL